MRGPGPTAMITARGWVPSDLACARVRIVPSGGSSCPRPPMQTLDLAAGEGPRGVASLLRARSRACLGFVRL